MVHVKTVAALFIAAGAIAPVLAIPVESETVLQSREASGELIQREPLALKPSNAASSGPKLPKTPVSALGSARHEQKSLSGAQRGSKRAQGSKSAEHESTPNRSHGLSKVRKVAGSRRVKAEGASRPSRHALSHHASAKLSGAGASGRRVASNSVSNPLRSTSSRRPRDLDAELEGREQPTKAAKKANKRRRQRQRKLKQAKAAGASSDASDVAARDLDEVELMEREPILGINHLKKWAKDRMARKAAKKAEESAAQSDGALAAREDSEDLLVRYLEESEDLFEREPILGINHLKKWAKDRKARKAAKKAEKEAAKKAEKEAAAASQGDANVAARDVDDLEGLLTRELEEALD